MQLAPPDCKSHVSAHVCIEENLFYLVCRLLYRHLEILLKCELLKKSNKNVIKIFVDNSRKWRDNYWRSCRQVRSAKIFETKNLFSIKTQQLFQGSTQCLKITRKVSFLQYFEAKSKVCTWILALKIIDHWFFGRENSNVKILNIFLIFEFSR